MKADKFLSYIFNATVIKTRRNRASEAKHLFIRSSLPTSINVLHKRQAVDENFRSRQKGRNNTHLHFIYFLFKTSEAYLKTQTDSIYA